VPVPGRDVNDDAARLHGTIHHCRDIGDDESDKTAGQMKAVHRRQNVNEGNAGASGEVKASQGQFAPNEKLSGKKGNAEDGGQGKPGEMSFVAQRDARNRAHRSERGFARDIPPRLFNRDAAKNKDDCVNQ
jgi:hypothetical protein